MSSRATIQTAPAAPVVQQTAGLSLQRRCACGQHTRGGSCSGCENKKGTLQRQALRTSTPEEIPPIVHDVLNSPGQPLDNATRAFMEPRFRHDFSQVRIHADAKATESATAVNALAYTVGNNVVFGAAPYAPHTGEGQRILAHELTHVVQQQTQPQPVSSSLQLGAPDTPHEAQAESVSRNLDAAANIEAAPPAVAKLQRDLARPPANPNAVANVLTQAEIQAAIAFNQARFSDPYSITVIRDVLGGGLDRTIGTVDEDFVLGVVQWQAERNETQDGKIGHITTRSLVLELIAAGAHRDAVMLIFDSYALPTSPRLNDVRVGLGANCCGATGTADAVTRGGVCPGGGAVNVCVCRTSFPPTIGYDHFVRIIGHEMIHVPHCAGAAFSIHATEFDAFAWEACSTGRAPQLTAAQRVNHANIALGHFAAMPAADQTAARVAMRNQLNNLVAAGGVGPCV